MMRRAYALLALQARLSLRTWSHGKTVATIIGTVIILVAAAGALGLGYFAHGFTRALLMDYRPLVRLLIFDGFVFGFFMFTLWGLLVEAQRGDLLDLRKLMHLPVSPGLVFTINYLYSLLSPGLLFYAPAATGITLGLRDVIGNRALLLILLFVLFYFMLSAWTYHARGWVAIVLQDRKKRRVLAVLIPVLAILVAQSPALVQMATGDKDVATEREKILEDPAWVQRIYQANLLLPPLWLALGAQQVVENSTTLSASALGLSPSPPASGGEGRGEGGESHHTLEALTNSLPLTPSLSPAEPGERGSALDEEMVEFLPFASKSSLASMLPPGMLPAMGLLLVACLGILAGYRTTVRYYRRGGAAAGQGRENVRPQHRALTQWGHPFLSGQSAALTWAFLLDYARHPAVRSQMVMPPLMTLIFCASILMQKEAGAWTGNAVPLFVLVLPFLGSTMMLFNIFGTDRQGFRALMLLPAPRHRILLAKNLALFPFLLAQCALTIGLGAALLRVPPQMVALQILQVPAAYCLFCVAGNVLSVYAPTPMSRDALRAHGSRLMLMVRGIAYAIFTIVAFLPSIGILSAASFPAEYALPVVWVWGAAAGYIAVTFGLYWIALTHTGDLLTTHEQRILAALAQEAA